MTNAAVGVGQRRTHHTAEGHADRAHHRTEGGRLDRRPRAQGLHHVWPIQEGYREGWRDHPTCYHQGHDSQDEQQVGPSGLRCSDDDVRSDE